ncbi:hypothetical protein D3C87_1146620 [compost metagenome]
MVYPNICTFIQNGIIPTIGVISARTFKNQVSDDNVFASFDVNNSRSIFGLICRNQFGSACTINCFSSLILKRQSSRNSNGSRNFNHFYSCVFNSRFQLSVSRNGSFGRRASSGCASVLRSPSRNLSAISDFARRVGCGGINRCFVCWLNTCF